MSDYVTKLEFERFVQINEQRYFSLFNRILGLDMVVRTLVLPLASAEDTQNKVADILKLLDDLKRDLLASGQIAVEHQKDLFFTLNMMTEMLQSPQITQEAEAKSNE